MSSAPHTIDITPYGSAIASNYRRSGAKPAVPASSRRRHLFSKLRSELIMRAYIYRSEILTVAYIATVLASPLGDSNPLIAEGLALLTLVILLAGASYMVSRKIARTVVFPIATVWLLAHTLAAFGYRHPALAHLSPIAGFVLSIAVLCAILRRLASPPLVTTGVIAETFIGYLALASAFAQIYWMMSRFIATPFNQPISESQISTLMYFSMVTLTSVGYGGIAPVDPHLRMVAALESMLGIFYVAVIVARLASYYRASRKAQE
jgi:voltage-gated potassium channel